MATNEVDAYLGNLDDFARAYLFKIYLTFPVDLKFQHIETTALYAKSTTLPDISVEEVSSYFMGQQFRMSSVRRYSDWMVTLYIDKATNMYKALYSWNRLCHSSESRYGMPKEYMVGYKTNPGRQVVQLYGSEKLDKFDYGEGNKPVMTYYLNYAWPRTIANVALDYESNQFLTMDVTFSFQYYEVE
jgi:hypothetical protein